MACRALRVLGEGPVVQGVPATLLSHRARVSRQRGLQGGLGWEEGELPGGTAVLLVLSYLTGQPERFLLEPSEK